MDDDIKFMVKQTTEEAKYFINSNREAQAIVRGIVADTTLGTTEMASKLRDKAVQYAESHDEMFGSLLTPELDAVNWEEIVRDEV